MTPHKLPFIAGCSHFTRQNKVSCSGFLPNTSPTQDSCSHYNAICNLRFNKRIELRTTTCCRTSRENHSHVKTNRPHPPHTRATCHRRLQPLYTAKHKVSCSGFLPNTSPTQDSCSHYNAICNLRFNKRIELRTYEQPHVAEHQGRTNHTSKRTVRTRRTHELPVIAGCSHFTRQNTRFRAPASSPTRVPRKIHAAITMRFATCDSTSAHMNNHTLQKLNTPSSPLPFVTTSLGPHFHKSPHHHAWMYCFVM